MDNSHLIRKAFVDDLDKLRKYHINSNRHYSQLFSGQLSASFVDANLGHVHIMEESLNLGARVESFTPDAYIPFAFVFPNDKDFNFCGHRSFKNSFVQIGSGSWDVNFRNDFGSIATVFNRDYFVLGYEKLMGLPFLDTFSNNAILPANQFHSNAYASGVSRILNILQCNQFLLNVPKIVALLNSIILKLALDTCSYSISSSEKEKSHSKRIKGVKKVMDYLKVSIHELPNMQTLCSISNLSERTLQYGFLDYIGLTPIQYMRVLRLNGVRSDLKKKEPHQRISDIALHWGFLELGRFSGDYKSLFMELPSETVLRNS